MAQEELPGQVRSGVRAEVPRNLQIPTAEEAGGCSTFGVIATSAPERPSSNSR